MRAWLNPHKSGIRSVIMEKNLNWLRQVCEMIKKKILLFIFSTGLCNLSFI